MILELTYPEEEEEKAVFYLFIYRILLLNLAWKYTPFSQQYEMTMIFLFIS